MIIIIIITYYDDSYDDDFIGLIFSLVFFYHVETAKLFFGAMELGTGPGEVRSA